MLALRGVAAVFVVSEAECAQKEFGKKRMYDAMQFVTVDVKQMHEKKNKYLAIFAENKCSRPIQALARFQVTQPSLKHARTGWLCHFKEYKSCSRKMVSDRGQYDRAK